VRASGMGVHLSEVVLDQSEVRALKTSDSTSEIALQLQQAQINLD
jgi:hypothetical protein